VSPDEREKFELEKWHKYELIAMHFNDLIIRFRLHALAGIAAVSALIGVMLNNKVEMEQRPVMLFILSISLCVAWGAMWALDHWYYQNLLIGSVEEIKKLENTTEGRITFSKGIEEYLETQTKSKRPKGPYYYYLIIFVFLMIGVFACAVNWWVHNDKPPQATQIVIPNIR
jgi:hypothetical protein